MNKKIKFGAIAGFVLLLLLAVKICFQERFDSVEAFRNYMEQLGIFAPLFLTVFQTMQVVVPVLPGYLGCAGGAIAFGTMTGFWCNYIGISAGSIIAYFLARKFGVGLVLELFSQEQYDKWSKKVEQSKSYMWFVFLATLLPFFPDDFLCYFSGLIRMDKHKFIGIILLGKPWCILLYSVIFGML